MSRILTAKTNGFNCSTTFDLTVERIVSLLGAAYKVNLVRVGTSPLQNEYREIVFFIPNALCKTNHRN